jgi:hypothetical protein
MRTTFTRDGHHPGPLIHSVIHSFIRVLCMYKPLLYMRTQHEAHHPPLCPVPWPWPWSLSLHSCSLLTSPHDPSSRLVRCLHPESPRTQKSLLGADLTRGVETATTTRYCISTSAGYIHYGTRRGLLWHKLLSLISCRSSSKLEPGVPFHSNSLDPRPPTLNNPGLHLHRTRQRAQQLSHKNRPLAANRSFVTDWDSTCLRLLQPLTFFCEAVRSVCALARLRTSLQSA